MNRVLMVLAALAVAFVTFSSAVAMGAMTGADLAVESLAAGLYWDPVHWLWQGIALAGGLELTTLVALGTAVWLFRSGFRVDALALLVFPLATLAETGYKALVHHPGPPGAHADGPSVTELLERAAALTNSFPSGHVTRAVVAYGVLAFLLHRLYPERRLGRWAVPAAILAVAAVSIDRLILRVHWESDVVGGLLLGGVAVAVAVAWLDRPRPA